MADYLTGPAVVMIKDDLKSSEEELIASLITVVVLIYGWFPRSIVYIFSTVILHLNFPRLAYIFCIALLLILPTYCVNPFP